MSDVVERLQGSRTPQGGLWPYPNLHDEAADEITRLREENARLREALKPFAMAAHSDIDSNLNLLHAICSLTLDDFRRARVAIREGGQDENKKD